MRSPALPTASRPLGNLARPRHIGCVHADAGQIVSDLLCAGLNGGVLPPSVENKRQARRVTSPAVGRLVTRPGTTNDPQRGDC